MSKRVRDQAVLPDMTAVLEQRFGPIEYRSPEALTAYANNPRKHSKKQVTQIAASMRQFGFTMPVLVDANGQIIAGEARIAAAREVGLRVVPVLVATQWSDAQIKAYRIADNRLAEHATWDEDLLRIELQTIIEIADFSVEVTGFSTGEIDVLLDGGGGPSADPADVQLSPPATPVSVVGDIWSLGDHRLLCGSSLEEENWKRLMQAKQARMAFCDAPFNVPVNGHVCGLGKAKHAEFAMASGEMTPAEFAEFNSSYLQQLKANTCDGAIIMACMDWRGLSAIQAGADAAELKLINLCVWAKSNGGMGSLYRSQHELVLILKNGSAPHINNVELGKHGRYRTNVWQYAGINSFGATRDADLAAHPTVKPTLLVADAIRDVTRQGDLVIDAFMGSGTTILAAERAKRVAYGIEIAPGYVDVAIQRWMTMTGKEAVLAETGETFAQVAARRTAEPIPQAA